jgi:hypothetical protein
MSVQLITGHAPAAITLAVTLIVLGSTTANVNSTNCVSPAAFNILTLLDAQPDSNAFNGK